MLRQSGITLVSKMPQKILSHIQMTTFMKE